MKYALVVVVLVVIIGGEYLLWRIIAPTPPMPIVNQNQNPHAMIVTSAGTFEVELYVIDAPNTVNNFITLAEKNFYSNLNFHRVVKGFVIQSGDPNGNGTGGPGYAFADELNPATKSYQEGYVKGALAMANSGPNTNGSQWFVTLADLSKLPKLYTIFGRVTRGQDVADAIGLVPVDERDMPVTPVIISSITIKR